MSQLQEKVNKSIERLKAFEPPEGYYLAFSGGKDSVVCKALLDMSGCKYDSTYRVTTVDPPELVKFIKDEHPDVIREIPRYSESYKNEKLAGKPITMWNLIPEKMMPPTRIVRYCCAALKESGGDGRMTVTGVRWEESYKRKQNQGIVTIADKKASKNEELVNNSDFLLTNLGGVVLTNDNTESRKVVEHCYKQHRTTVNPIIEWSEQKGFRRKTNIGMVYCLTNFNSTMEENLYRIYVLSSLGFDPYVMVYDKPHAPQEIRDLQRWCNNKIIFKSCKRFEDYKKG